ncbi:MAG: DUF3168 domain-containing protein [Deltaproteobacteria bacterium]|jgi:hypothetical protein|nr:DUF3168 domain-containing protein [Deltaproteobacteria bacterium]
MATPVYVEHAVDAALRASAEVVALCAGRVYPLKLPQGAMLPAVAYLRTAGSPDYTLQGYGSESVTLVLNSFAPTYGEAKDLALAVRRVMAAAPINAILRKEADVYDENAEAPCVSAEYLVQQSGGHCHG